MAIFKEIPVMRPIGPPLMKVMKYLYKINKDIRIVSATTTYVDQDHFNATYPDTWNKNIGSVVNPAPYGSCCTCEQ